MAASAPSQPQFNAAPLSLAEARRAARRHNVIPLTRTILADLETPVAAYLKLTRGGQAPYAYLLESVTDAEVLGRYSYLGWAPYRLLRQREGQVWELRPPDKRWRKLAGDMVSLAREEVARRKIPPLEGLPFIAGAVGYFGYDMVRTVERLPQLAEDDLGLDEALLMFYSRQVIFDHIRRTITLVACAMPEPGRTLAAEYARARRDLAAMEKTLAGPPPKARPAVALPGGRGGKALLRARMSPRQFRAKVERAKEYILAGDAFQIVLSQRWDAPAPAPAFQVYRALRAVNPSPYMFHLKMDETEVAGASPEMLVSVRAGELQYRPIAGTRPRGENAAADRALEEEMTRDEKERAEHVMLVDLGRNDIGRVAEVGSVRVERLMFVERYSHVMHLVSEVRGRLRRDLDCFDALMACFPAGTLSGAPKVRAMEIIEELEPTRRGVYAGAVMYLDFSGNLNSCVAIRTMVMRRGRAHLQAGAGIVADSDPAFEHLESRNKARALARALQLASRGL